MYHLSDLKYANHLDYIDQATYILLRVLGIFAEISSFMCLICQVESLLAHFEFCFVLILVGPALMRGLWHCLEFM